MVQIINEAAAKKAAAVTINEAKAASQAKKEASKTAKAAEKEAKKASKAASQEGASKEAKAEAKKAEAKAKKAAEVLAAAEAKEASAADKASKAKEAAKEASRRINEGTKSLTIKAEAVRKGLNAAARALIEAASAEGVSDTEIISLVLFACEEIPASDKAAAALLPGIKAADIIAAYRKYSPYAVSNSEGRKVVAKAAAAFAGANVYTFEAASNFNINNLFRTPANNKRRQRRQEVMKEGVFYERQAGKYIAISKAEAAARIKAAKEEAARQAEAKAKAEALAEKDRQEGEAARKAREAKEAKAKAKAKEGSQAAA